MIRRHALLLFLTICWLNVGAAEETDILRQFDERIESAAAFEYGDDPVALHGMADKTWSCRDDFFSPVGILQCEVGVPNADGFLVFWMEGN